MKNKILLIVWMFLAIGFLTKNLSAQEPNPTPYVRTDAENALIERAIEAARRDGKARVIVVFDEPYVPNSPEYVARVTALQNELLERLVPYQITLRFLYTVIPGLALEGSEAALMVIRDSPRVRYIELDAVVYITPPKSRKRSRIF
jgi:sugar phosphate isomerase/epimerase